MKNMKNLKKLKEKKFAEKADRSKNTISLLRKHAFVLAVIVAALMLFHAQKDYNNFLGLAFMCQQWTQRALSQVMVEI